MSGPPVPQKPENSHIKETSKISVRTIGRDADHEVWGRDSDPAGWRTLQVLRTNIGTTRNGVELLPKQSGDARDPLVLSPVPSVVHNVNE